MIREEINEVKQAKNKSVENITEIRTDSLKR